MNTVAKKLLMRPGQYWLLFSAPESYLATLDPLPDDLQIRYEAKGSFDGIQLFVINSTELAAGLKHIMPVLKPATVLWIIYPKKSSGIPNDLLMISDRDEPAKYGLSGVSAASIDSTWTAMRFRRQELTKASVTRNDALPDSPYAKYIDVTNKQVILPPDVVMALAEHPFAMENYEKLSYSNKKEYVLWILTAKQDKTRTDRIFKMVDKLLNGKKNPSEK